MTYRVALDTNCLIDLEQQSELGEQVADLRALHNAGRIELCIPAVSASERQPGGVYFHNFKEFEQRLEALGLSSATLLSPIAYFGIAFFGHGLYGGAESSALDEAIHDILHPEIAFGYRDYCSAHGLDPEATLNRRWRNAKCDVLIAWTHIHYRCNLLVTNDDNFHKLTKVARLTALGAGPVVRTADAMQHVERSA